MGEVPLPAEDPPELEETEPTDKGLEYVTPRMVWGGATNFMGITDRVNPGHFERPRAGDDAE